MVAPVSPVTHSPFSVFSPLHFRSLFRWWCCHAQAGFLQSRTLSDSCVFFEGKRLFLAPESYECLVGSVQHFRYLLGCFFVSQTIAVFHAVPFQSAVITCHRSLTVSLSEREVSTVETRRWDK